MKKLIILFIGLFTLYVASANSAVEVKGLKLKFVLFQTAEDIYKGNISKPDYFNKMQFYNKGRVAKKYYDWVMETYSQFPENKKHELSRIFENHKANYYMWLVAHLDDSANIKEILIAVTKSGKFDSTLCADINNFFNYFYSGYLQKYIHKTYKRIDRNVKKVQLVIDSDGFDILKFMEEKSGCKFEKNIDKIQYYYTLSILSAGSFSINQTRISTLQQTRTDLKDILQTAFHEFSHSLFWSFSKKDLFIETSGKLQKNEKFKEMALNHSYDWRGWCEENLVNGFAAFLVYKRFGEFNWNGNYYYDKDFYEYLKKIDFNPKNVTLEKVSIEFMKLKEIK